jgi:hypothetical protein
MGGFYLSLCPTTVNAEGGITDPILGDTNGTPESAPAPPDEIPSVFWVTCTAMMNSLL